MGVLILVFGSNITISMYSWRTLKFLLAKADINTTFKYFNNIDMITHHDTAYQQGSWYSDWHVLYTSGVLTPSMRGEPALHSMQQACLISSLAASSCFSSYAALMFSRVGEGPSAEPAPGPSTDDAFAPMSSPLPDST